jgi:signal transduction histidine kinase
MTAAPFLLPLQPAVVVPVGALLLALALGRRRSARLRILADERMRAMADGSAAAIAILDPAAGVFVEGNSNALALFGVDRDALRTHCLLDFSPERLPAGEPLAPLFETAKRAALAGERQVLTWVVNAPDGRSIPCELRLSLFPSSGGALLRLSLVDIRDRLAQEAVADEMEKLFRHTQKMEAVGKLTGGVAHDFNNELTVILGNLEMAADCTDDERPIFLRQAALAAERSARLTRSLLAYARRQTLSPRSVALADVLSDLDGLLRSSLGSRVELVVDLPLETWPVYLDPTQLEAVILNLAFNARDAMPDGGRFVIAAANVAPGGLAGTDITLPPERGYVRLSVSDTGIGMPEEVRSKAFDPFFTTKGVGQGSGLGLSMVYGFVTQSGGTARLQSREGAGTEVILYLPRSVPIPA